MSNYEILLAEDEARLGSALEVTRRMRTAALAVKDEGHSARVQDMREQSILLDAQKLAVAAATVAILSKRDRGTGEVPDVSVLAQKRTSMDTVLEEISGKYGSYAALTYVKSGSPEGFRRTLRALDQGWEQVLEQEYRGMNNVGLSVEQLASRRVGVLAPLSMDYLRAEIHRAYIESKGQPSFEVRPAVTDRFGDNVILPHSRRGRQAFTDKRDLVLYVDRQAFGFTARALWMAAERLYPGKPIHGSGSEPILPDVYKRARLVARRTR